MAMAASASLSALFQSPIFLASMHLPWWISTSCSFCHSTGSDWFTLPASVKCVLAFSIIPSLQYGSQSVIVQSRKTSIFDYTLVNIKTIRTTIQRIWDYPRRGQSTIDNAGKQSLSAALCDAHRVKSTLTHCNILPTIKMQTFSCFSCNHRIRAFTSKTS